MASNMRMENCTNNGGFLYETITQEVWTPWSVAAEHFVYTPWLFSLLGSSLVGLAGIFPLLVIPIDEGANLKNGAGAGTLKVLLSFAVGGLLGDVFLHLLPEAWENEYLETAIPAENHDVRRSTATPCGLWVLCGFLVFVIVEKMFAFESEPMSESGSECKSEYEPRTDKSSVGLNEGPIRDCTNHFFDHQLEREMENNNCIMAVGGCSKEAFTKRCAKLAYAKDTIEEPCFRNANPTDGLVEVPVPMSIGCKALRSNDLKNTDELTSSILKSRAHGSTRRLDATIDSTALDNVAEDSHPVKIPSAVTSTDVRRFKESKGTPRGAVSEFEICQIAAVSSAAAPAAATHAKDNNKHVTGYLNLMANIIDNFTHGLAVGGSFLVSFRLGALTTFAILVHEIPHEVGDFAILLRSGFSRWDAARAQLLTASGGIFGALAAVFFSASGVVSKTNWILPFTAGGFLHIGMVTILPELLQEANPKESLKQLGALLIGILLMAILTFLCD